MKLPRFQFRLRSLLVLTLIVAVPCAYCSRKLERKRREREVLKTVSDCGADVVFDYQSDKRGGVQAEPPGPKWLREILGDDFFGEATFCFARIIEDVEAERLTNALKELPYLEEVEVEMCGMDTDATLAKLAELTQIKDLHLSSAMRLTDAGLMHLKRLTGLRRLSMAGEFSDAAIRELQKALPNCRIEH
jgi:hypothetical protein